MDPIIQIQNISFSYNEAPRKALDGVTLDIFPGTFTAVLGSNGSGKSTLAKHLNAILLPTEGSVLVEGMDTRTEENLIPIRRRVGMVFQNPDNQIVANVVEDDVAFAPENLGVEPSEIRQRVDDALRAVGMFDFRMHAPHLLSGGQKQRIAIAGVLAMQPQVLVLDEPTAMLDPRGRREVMDTIESLRREKGITVILITHHMDEAARADRILLMDKGRLVMDGPPRVIFPKTEALRALSLDVPAAAALTRGLRDAGMDLPADILTPEECADALASVLAPQ